MNNKNATQFLEIPAQALGDVNGGAARKGWSPLDIPGFIGLPPEGYRKKPAGYIGKL